MGETCSSYTWFGWFEVPTTGLGARRIDPPRLERESGYYSWTGQQNRQCVVVWLMWWWCWPFGAGAAVADALLLTRCHHHGGNTLSDLKDADCDSGKRSLFLLTSLSFLGLSQGGSRGLWEDPGTRFILSKGSSKACNNASSSEASHTLPGVQTFGRVPVGAPQLVHENLRKPSSFSACRGQLLCVDGYLASNDSASGRTNNRSRSPRWVASSQWD